MDTWIFLMVILQVASCLGSFHYAIHGDAVSFEKAKENCQHVGYLTSLETDEEFRVVQEAVLQQNPADGTHTYWIGLWRLTGTCHEPYTQLKGFLWINGGDQGAQGIKWNNKPPETCTNDRCAYMSITYEGAAVKDWGLVSESCKKEHPFICKVKGEKTTPAPKRCTRPVIGETHDYTQQMDEPSKMSIVCLNKTHELTCALETLTWTRMDGSPVDFSTLCAPCLVGHQKSDTGECVDINECEKRPCRSDSTCVNTVGSYVCKDMSQPTNNQLTPVEEHAHHTPPPPAAHLPDEEGDKEEEREDPATTRAPEEAVVNPDEEVLVHATPPSPDYSKIYIPVVVAVLALLLLLVLILAVVACCRRRKRRRSKSLAGHKSNKESMALRDSMEKVNDK